MGDLMGGGGGAGAPAGGQPMGAPGPQGLSGGGGGMLPLLLMALMAHSVQQNQQRKANDPWRSDPGQADTGNSSYGGWNEKPPGNPLIGAPNTNGTAQLQGPAGMGQGHIGDILGSLTSMMGQQGGLQGGLGSMPLLQDLSSLGGGMGGP